MCTVTILREASSVLATMNRDEALTRGPELPPRKHVSKGGLDWMAPHDSDKGGTWMGTNALGVVACLLNAYRPGESLRPDPSGGFRSRGEIIPEALERGSVGDALAWLLGEFDPRLYPSFDLMLVSPDAGMRVTWLGQGKVEARDVATGWTVISSSGWDSRDVIRWREREFERWRAAGCALVGTLPSFHLLQEAGHEDRSPLMKRDWSSTRSVTQVRVDAVERRVSLRYWPDPKPSSTSPDSELNFPMALERQDSSLGQAVD